MAAGPTRLAPSACPGLQRPPGDLRLRAGAAARSSVSHGYGPTDRVCGPAPPSVDFVRLSVSGFGRSCECTPKPFDGGKRDGPTDGVSRLVLAHAARGRPDRVVAQKGRSLSRAAGGWAVSR